MSAVVIGQIGRDLVLRTDGPPSANEATTVLQRDELLGGKGANQAVGLAQLGVPVALIGVVGDDPAGTSVLLGRDPAESLVAAAFARFDNVSRRHATVQVDDAGHASITDENSTNGTYVNDDRVLPGTEVRLVDGDRVRLGADVTGDVSLPQAEPDPSGLSRNNMRLGHSLN